MTIKTPNSSIKRMIGNNQNFFFEWLKSPEIFQKIHTNSPLLRSGHFQQPTQA